MPLHRRRRRHQAGAAGDYRRARTVLTCEAMTRACRSGRLSEVTSPAHRTQQPTRMPSPAPSSGRFPGWVRSRKRRFRPRRRRRRHQQQGRSLRLGRLGRRATIPPDRRTCQTMLASSGAWSRENRPLLRRRQHRKRSGLKAGVPLTHRSFAWIPLPPTNGFRCRLYPFPSPRDVSFRPDVRRCRCPRKGTRAPTGRQDQAGKQRRPNDLLNTTRPFSSPACRTSRSLT